MKKIVFTRPDGGISVIKPTIDFPRERLTEEQALQRAMKDVPKDAADVRVVESLAAMGFKDKSFRDAWTQNAIDMEKAREIHKQRLRGLREPLLKALDLAFMLALESGDGIEEIVAKKKALRDVTKDPRISEAKTPDELRAVVPECLQPNP